MAAQDSALEAGRAALARAAWAEARACFEAALAEAETPAALGGLGTAARWERDAATALSAHVRGYRLARSLGDARAAAALALDLVFDRFDFRGPAEARGWLERSGRARELVLSVRTVERHVENLYAQLGASGRTARATAAAWAVAHGHG